MDSPRTSPRCATPTARSWTRPPPWPMLPTHPPHRRPVSGTPPRSWPAHVSLVTATTVAAVARVVAGTNTTYDNRTAFDTWTIDPSSRSPVTPRDFGNAFRLQEETSAASPGRR